MEAHLNDNGVYVIMKRYGSELKKINWIAPDGSHLSYADSPELRKDEIYTLNRLSISNDTYIASGFNSFVVKLKNSPNDQFSKTQASQARGQNGCD